MAVYYGFDFPLIASDDSFPARVTDGELLKKSLYQILMTSRLERINRPDFGTNVHDYVFENNNPALEAALRSEVALALARFEPRVSVLEITTSRSDSTLTVTIQYVVDFTKSVESLSVPIPTSQST
jgi:phage baseplate assembly protein W